MQIAQNAEENAVEPTMSCHPFTFLIGEFDRRGIPEEIYLKGISKAKEHLLNGRLRLPWDEYMRVFDNVEEYFTDDEWIALGREQLKAPFYSFLPIVMRLLYDCRGVYAWILEGPDSQMEKMDPSMNVACTELPGNRLLYEMTGPQGHKISRAGSLQVLGIVRSFPTLIGLPVSEGELVWSPDIIQIRIKYPSGHSPLWKLRRWLSRPFMMRSAGLELRKANEELQDRYDDLSEQMQAREEAQLELAQRESQLRLLAENMRDVIWSADGEGRLTYVSPSIEKLSGFTPAALLDAPLSDLVTVETRPALESFWHGARAGEQEEAVLELEYRTTFGHTVWCEMSCTAVRDDAGILTGVQGVTRDISERIAAESAKASAEAQLRQTQRIETIGTLAGGIAHDFNNLLQSMMGRASMALANSPEGSEAHVHLEKLRTAVHRAKKLVKQITTFSRQDDAERIPLNISKVVEEALELLRASLPETVELRRSIAQDTGTVLGDQTQVHQVVMNLGINAFQAMPEGGTLTVTMKSEAISEEAARLLVDLPEGDYLRLTVSDTGIGMKPEVVEHIFEPFYTTRRDEDGVGLGLSVVHGIVHAHGGVVAVETEPGGGSSFHVYLPLFEGSVSIDEPQEELTFEGSGHILLVEDDEENAQLAEHMLLSWGYKVTVKPNGLDALSALESTPGAFDLIITDHIMPKMSGAKLARRALELYPSLPIIMVTGYSEKITAEDSKALGIKEYLAKPYTPQELGIAVQHVMNDVAATNMGEGSVASR